MRLAEALEIAAGAKQVRIIDSNRQYNNQNIEQLYLYSEVCIKSSDLSELLVIVRQNGCLFRYSVASSIRSNCKCLLLVDQSYFCVYLSVLKRLNICLKFSRCQRACKPQAHLVHLRAFESGSAFFSFWHRLHIPSLSIIFNVSTAWKRMLISRSASNTRFCTYFTFSRAWNKFHESPRLELVSLTRALRFHVFLRQESSFPMLEFVFTFPLFHSG